MPLQTFTITADVPDGFEPTGEYRPPKCCEPFADHVMKSTIGKLNYGPAVGSYPILRPVWKWPELSAPGTWYSRGASGLHCLSVDEPQECVGGFRIYGECVFFDDKQARMLGFTPPPCTDWRHSKRQKPVA
jgi:hypothetical protein